MFKPLKHPNVKVLEGVAELVGKTGVIIDKEDKMYRVRLDQPVEVPGVGRVTDDLWMPAALKVIRPPSPKAVLKASTAAVAEPVAMAPVEPAPEPAPEAGEPVAGTPASLEAIESAEVARAQAASCGELPTVFEEEQLLADMTLACQTGPRTLTAVERAEVIETICRDRKPKAPAKKAKVNRGAVVRRKAR